MADTADAELPKAVIKRVVKAKLAEKQVDTAGAKRDFQVSKDALTAFSQATKVFISYVATAANDICKENKRSTIAVNDVTKALQELEFEGFLPQIEQLLSSVQTAKRKSSHDGAGPAAKAPRKPAVDDTLHALAPPRQPVEPHGDEGRVSVHGDGDMQMDDMENDQDDLNLDAVLRDQAFDQDIADV